MAVPFVFTAAQSCVLVKCLIICLTLVLQMTVVGCCYCERVPAVVEEAEGKALVDHCYVNLNISRIVVCASRCMRQAKCKSFNYDTQQTICCLNTETRLTAPDSFVATDNQHLVHYDIKEWPQSLLGACANHGCAPDKVCVSGYPSPRCRETFGGDVAAPDIQYNSQCTVSTSCADCIPTREVNGHTFGPVGCFYSGGSSHTLPETVVNLRGGIDWTDLTITIDQCAAAASEYALFGIEYYGECYAGSMLQANYGGGEVDVADCDSKCPLNVGSDNHMMVYQWLP